MRYSKQRECILQAVKSTKCHPNAEWVYEQVKKAVPGVSLGTVYRNLKSLSESRDLITLETEKGKIHYDGDTSQHAHFICGDCGRILDIFMLSELKNKIEGIGMKVECEKIVFYGKCAECSAEIATSEVK